MDLARRTCTDVVLVMAIPFPPTAVQVHVCLFVGWLVGLHGTASSSKERKGQRVVEKRHKACVTCSLVSLRAFRGPRVCVARGRKMYTQRFPLATSVNELREHTRITRYYTPSLSLHNTASFRAARPPSPRFSAPLLALLLHGSPTTTTTTTDVAISTLLNVVESEMSPKLTG